MVLTQGLFALLHAAWQRRNAAYSLIDQVIYALALFIFTLLVTRALPTEQFGLVSVYLAWISLIGAILQPLLIDSSVVLAAREREGAALYIAAARKAYQHVVALMLALAVLVSLVTGIKSLASIGVWVLLSEIAVSYCLFMRRSVYVTGSPASAVGLAVTNLALTIGLVPLIFTALSPTVYLVFVARACINILTCVVARLMSLTGGASEFSGPIIGERLKRIVSFSREYVGGSLIFWITNSMQVALIGHFITLQSAAGYRVAQLMLIPAIQLQAAAYQYFLPKIVARMNQTVIHMGSELCRLLMAFLVPTLFYVVLVGAGGGWLLGKLFGVEYEEYGWLLRVFCALAVLDALKQMAVVLIYAQDQKKLFMQFRIFSLGMFVCCNLPAILLGSLVTFAIVMLFSTLLQLLWLYINLFRLKRSA